MNHENGHRSCVKVTVTKPLPAGRRGCLDRSRQTSSSEASPRQSLNSPRTPRLFVPDRARSLLRLDQAHA